MIEFDPDNFSGEAPVFPLPNVVLFPHLVLPLHIFEHRYREMVRDALAGENLVAMALYRPGLEEEEGPETPFHQTVTLGQVLQQESLPDGKFNISLLGVARARVRSSRREKPYWQAGLELLREDVDAMEIDRVRAYTDTLWKIYGDRLAPPAKALPLPVLCDLIVSSFVSDVRLKQEFLETLDIPERCEKLVSLSPPPPPRRPWPKFSNN